MEFVVEENWVNLEKTYPDPVSHPRNPRGVIETRSRDPAVGGKRLTTCATVPPVTGSGKTYLSNVKIMLNL